MVEIDYPVSVFADAFPHLGAFFAQVGNALPGVVDAICGSLRGAESEGAIAGVYREPGAILKARVASYTGNDAGRVIALDIVANHAFQ